jgi:hypothetical protein
MSAGCEYYLAFVVATDGKNVNISTVPIVSEYPDVFSDELPGLSPPRDVEVEK